MKLLIGVVPLVAGSPTDLTPGEARARLQQELLAPEYVERNLMSRLWEWLQRWIDDLLVTASSVPLARWIAGVVVLLLLVLVALAVVTRFRGSASPKTASTPSPVLATRLGADELRRRALAARERGDHGEAVVDAYRSLAVRQVERRRVLDVPGATAHEVGDQMAEVFPERAQAIRTAASLFDLALYSDRPVTHVDADTVLDLGVDLDALDRPRQRTP